MAWTKNGTPSTLTGTGSPEITDLTGMKFNQFLINGIAPSSTSAQDITFNGNINPVYARRSSLNGANDALGTYETSLGVGIAVSNNHFFVAYTCAIVGQEKLTILFYAEANTVGKQYAPNRREYVSKFVPNPDATITEIKLDMVSQTYAINSNISALGSEGTITTVNIQNGTIFEETDTNCSYIWNSSTNTWTQL